MSTDFEERTLTISGVKVIFPCKPYPSQFGMMDRVIKGLERRQNCLLESPTGSGKSLALLCSALAWQCSQHERIAREDLQAETDSSCCKPCQCGASKGSETKTEFSPGSKPGQDVTCTASETGVQEKPIVLSDDEDDDFKPMSKFRTPKLGQGAQLKRRHVSVAYDNDCASNRVEPPVKCTCNTETATGTKKKQKVAKIYFGTRTHKQIAQITRELGRTAYNDVRMTILASREYTCVHPEVTKMKSKSEGCRERLDTQGPGCTFNDKAKRVFLTQNQLQSELTTAWDLEDFVGTCKSKKACPYFVTRNIMDQADIVFCPYNYLVDPLVRKSMDINLKEQVVILDEAHNIEDCARDAASGSLTTDQITQAIHNLQEMLDCNVKFSDHLELKKMLENVLQFIEDGSGNLEQADYNTAFKVWSGFDIVVRLKTIGLGPDNFRKYQECLDSVSNTDEDEQTIVKNRRNQEVKLKSSTLQILEQLLQILDYMYRDDLRFVEDYRVAILKSVQYVPNRNTNNTWISRNKRGGQQMIVFTLNFWCMNPAVAFSDFSVCRNVVLSSGTLSPMVSFASELGAAFPIQLEANHVIQDKQVWVGALGTGPSGTQLQAVYRNMETLSFQDELGNLIHKVCMTVPHGVLCFLPSYRALEQFTKRWKIMRIWDKIASRKRIMVEPRAADREEFDSMMKGFYEVVKGEVTNEYLEEDEDDCCDDSDIDGAIFFAVCRGKVSEGMDFADNNARAVITVGIPFPSIKDLQVKLKREYNDKHRVDRGLLSGNEWYEIQAFRALNQALGRCIRHRKDWGALIIVDDRFVKNTAKYCKNLSKWVRSKVQTFASFSHCMETVSTFTQRMIKEMPVINPDTSFIPCTPGTSRRDSVYKQKELMDCSYQGTPAGHFGQSSYFSPQQDLAKKLLQTPDSSKKGNNSASTIPVIGNQSNCSLLVDPGAGSPLSIQQQLKQIIKSGAGPKDKPYYVILNQGLPNEQTFLIEPDKKGKPVTANTGTSNVSGNATIPQDPGAGSPLSIQQQLKQIIKSGAGPKDKPYYVILNQGLPNGQTFLIEPDKKGKPVTANTGTSNVSGNATIPQGLATSQPSTLPVSITSGQVKKEKSVEPGAHMNEGLLSNVGTNSNHGGQQNKFLKFCHLPKTPAAGIPVATVTPHRVGSAQEATDSAMNVSSNQRLETSSPTLFDDTPAVVSQDQSKEEANKAEEPVKHHSSIKKPLFKKKTPQLGAVGVNEIKLEPEINENNAEQQTGDLYTTDLKVKAEVENDKSVSDMNSNSYMTTDGVRGVSTRGKANKSVADKLKQFRRKSVDSECNSDVDIKDTKTILTEATSVIDAVENSEASSDEEFLNTRRKGGRKRRSSSVHKAGKKKRKGVDFEDGIGNEKTDARKFVTCAKCQSNWMISTDFERRRRHPIFMRGVCKKNTEVLYFPESKSDEFLLQNLSTDIKGVHVNSHVDTQAGCCIQYLQCKQCSTVGSNNQVVGARVVLAEKGSQFEKGQVWLLSSAVKT